MKRDVVIWMLWILFRMVIASNTPDIGYTLKGYDDLLGLYFEGLGQAMIYNTVWKATVCSIETADESSVCY
jgi:hypothetical protein